MVRSQVLLIFVVFRLRVEIDILDLTEVALLLGLVVFVELVVEEAVAKGALLEVPIVWIARLAVDVLPQFPQLLLRRIDVILELAISVSSGLR